MVLAAVASSPDLRRYIQLDRGTVTVVCADVSILSRMAFTCSSVISVTSIFFPYLTHLTTLSQRDNTILNATSLGRIDQRDASD